jgi:error-prone DNA polymerase
MGSTSERSDPDGLKALTRAGWHEWLCHTNFSFLAGASHPDECLDRAAALGYHGLGVTDFDGVYGLARTHLHGRKLKQRLAEAGEPPLRTKLFYGAELRLARDHDMPIVYQDTLAVVAQTREGYANLCALASYAHRGGKLYAHVPLADLLSRPVDGLVAIQPMRGLVRRASTWTSSHGALTLDRRLGDLSDHFGGRFYFAVTRHLTAAVDTLIAPTLAMARRLGRPCLMSQDAFFHEPARKPLSDVLHAIRTNRTLDGAIEHMFVNDEPSLHTLAEIAQRYRRLPIYEEALFASTALAESCVFSMDELKYRYPKEMIPDGHTAQSFLAELAWRSAKERFGDPVPERLAKTIAHELQLIEHLGFADYFLTVWDIVRWAREYQILCQGRGSAANSAVCYVLGVTAVDPATFDLLFERFMSVERGDPPDIDVDFEHERREEVIQYIYRRYGRARAAMVANVITFRGRGALRAVGKALGAPESALAEVARLLSARRHRQSSSDAVLAKAQEELRLDERTDGPGGEAGIAEPVEQLDGQADDETSHAASNLPWELWADLAEQLRGFPRHLGIHSGGFMLADVPLDHLVAQEPATMPGRSVVQWCKEDIEGLGFFKIDILALGMLTAIRKCYATINEREGLAHSLLTVPANDRATYEMIQRADTVGTFQIESRAQMSMLPRLRPDNFYDLVVEVAIIRPGPIQGGMIHPYLRRRAGEEPVDFPDARLEPILRRTLGIPLFQEQVMRIAIAVGNFTPGEANELRRHMGAWSLKGNMGPLLPKLAQGMRQNGLTDEFIHSILEQMKGFAHYGFPESHAVSFALIAYASAWLKRHHAAAFFQALLNSQPMGFYSPHALLQAAQRDGVRILPVCVNASDWDVTLERNDAHGPEHDQRNKRHKDQECPPGRWAIRLGMRLVHSLRRAAADEVMARRRAVGGRFRDLEHFLKEARLYRHDLTALAAADALRGFGIGRKESIWMAEAAGFSPVLEDVGEGGTAWRAESDAPTALDTAAEDAAAERAYPVLDEESTFDRIQMDFAATGTSLGPHPAAVIKAEHWCYEAPVARLTKAEDVTHVPAGRTVLGFGMILVRQSPPSAKGMVFLTLEDETGFLNLAFSPQVYETYCRLVERQTFLCVEARMQRQHESHSLWVLRVLAPAPRQAPVVPIGQSETRDAVQDAPLDLEVPPWAAEPLAPTRNYM